MTNTTTKHTLSIADVAYICNAAKNDAPRTRGQAYELICACDRRLKQASNGELAVAEGVRLPVEAVVRVLWKLRKAALAQWKEAKAADEQAKREEAEAQFLAEYREALAHEAAAELAEVAD